MQKRIELRRSPVSVGLWCFLYGGIFILLGFRIAAVFAWVLLLPVICWWAIGHWRSDRLGIAWIELPSPLQTGDPHIDLAPWRLGYRDERSLTADLASAFLHPWLTVLRFRALGWRSALVLLPGSADADELRQLRHCCMATIHAQQS